MFPDQPKFVELVLDCLSLTQTGLGDLLGYRNAYQAGHRIATGAKPLRYNETMLLLETCGWLNDLTEGPPALAEPRELFAVAVARLLSGQETLLREMRVLQRQADVTGSHPPDSSTHERGTLDG